MEDEESWISLHRKFMDWKWYKDKNTKTLFLHLLLQANYKDNYWKGILIKRGQHLTSLEHLSEETGLSVQETRTAIKKLKSTNEITCETTSKYTLVTIVKYDFYQDNNKKLTSNITSELTTNQQPTNKQATTNNNDNNILFNLSINNNSDFVGFEEGDEISQFLKTKGIESIDKYKELDKSKQDELIEEWFLTTS